MTLRKYRNIERCRARRITTVWHVGSLDLVDKQNNSQEGNGLSVSVHPKVWAQIARLGGGALFRLDRAAGRFLNFHRLTPAACVDLQSWGLDKGWLQLEARWQLHWYDSEREEISRCLCDSEALAKAELEEREEDPSAGVTQVQVPCLTETATTRLGFKLDPLMALDIAATFYVEDETDLDGVWWNDLLDPLSLSAPRGVICLRQLNAWSVSKLQGPASR